MKKFIKTTLIIFIGILSFKSIGVNAATSLPASYSQNGYDYTIDDFKIACYKGIGAVLKEENKIKEGKIDIPTTDLTIAPELKELTSKPVTGTLLPIISINLNLNTKQLFTTYAQNYMNDHYEIEQFTCVLKVDYKIKKKEGYNYFYNFDSSIFEHEQMENISEQEGYYPASQVIDFMMRDKNNFYSSSGNISGKEIALANYGILSKIDINETTAQDNENMALIYVHNLNNFEQVLTEKKKYTLVPDENNNPNNNSNNTNNDSKETPVYRETKQIQKVNVPDTSASSLKIMLISSIIMLLGAGILLYTIIKPKILDNNNK